jgi:hypothetical protein
MELVTPLLSNVARVAERFIPEKPKPLTVNVSAARVALVTDGTTEVIVGDVV